MKASKFPVRNSIRIEVHGDIVIMSNRIESPFIYSRTPLHTLDHAEGLYNALGELGMSYHRKGGDFRY